MVRKIWKNVVGYEGLYKVSNQGRVKSIERLIVDSAGHQYTLPGGIRALSKNRRGYYKVSLYRHNIERTREVHKLVIEAFKGPCPEGCEVRHKDGCRTNNKPSNLAYGTPEQNQADRKRHGTYTCNDLHPTTKLSNIQFNNLRKQYLNGGMTMAALAKEWGVGPTTVWRAVHKVRVVT